MRIPSFVHNNCVSVLLSRSVATHICLLSLAEVSAPGGGPMCIDHLWCQIAENQKVFQVPSCGDPIRGAGELLNRTLSKYSLVVNVCMDHALSKYPMRCKSLIQSLSSYRNVWNVLNQV